MTFINKTRTWLFSTRLISVENEKFFKITQAAFLFGMIAHGLSIPTYFNMGIQEMAWFNIFFSVPAFALAVFLNRNGKHNFAFLWAYLELLLHQIATTYYLGWSSGAYFWLIYLAGLSFFNSQWSLKIQLVLLFIVTTTFVSLYLFNQEGVYSITASFQNTFAIINGITVLFVLSLLIYYFATTAFKAETELKKEQALTASMLTKIEGLFGQQVSEEIAAEMIGSEKEIESKPYNATIMFMDIRDFTLFADSKPPSDVAHFQNTVFGALMNIIKNQHGVVLQLLGDGLMAVFGAPIATQHHAQNAVNASYDIVKKIDTLILEGRIPKIKVGIGLHSGDIIAGNLGNSVRKSYSLTGKNVIIAARIEPLNKKFNSQFLISESVYKNIQKDNIEAEDMGQIPLKGIEHPIKVYKLI